MAKISNQGQLTKTLQEVSPKELQETTKETYTTFKRKFLEENGSTPI
jgi:hypothetical protein